MREVVWALVEGTDLGAAPGGKQALSLVLRTVFVRILGPEERAAPPGSAGSGVTG